MLAPATGHALFSNLAPQVVLSAREEVLGQHEDICAALCSRLGELLGRAQRKRLGILAGRRHLRQRQTQLVGGRRCK
jgi:hypothetical protein